MSLSYCILLHMVISSSAISKVSSSLWWFLSSSFLCLCPCPAETVSTHAAKTRSSGSLQYIWYFGRKEQLEGAAGLYKVFGNQHCLLPFIVCFSVLTSVGLVIALVTCLSNIYRWKKMHHISTLRHKSM